MRRWFNTIKIRTKEFLWRRIETAITLLLIFLVFVCLLSSFLFVGVLQSLLINLSAGFVISLFTIWGVDYLRKRRDRVLWFTAEKVTIADLYILSNMLVSYVSGPLGKTVLDYKEEGNDLVKSGRIALKKIIEDLTASDLIEILEKRSTSEWSRLQLELIGIKSSINEYIQIYQRIIPPELFGTLLKTRRDFNSLYTTFGLIPELFTKIEKEWPLNAGGVENNRLIRKMLINSLGKDLKSYLLSVKEFINMLDEYV